MRTSPVAKKTVSATKEDYVRAIYLLQECGEAPGILQIAGRLNLSKSTVSERIKELTAEGLTLSKPYSTISLTKEGVALGKKMTYKHRLIEVFLHQTLKLPRDKVHKEAERLEHAFSDEAIEHLDSFLKHPTHDPHGSPITY
ncbi:MAG: metal-dependent transcriptional regulator [Patescibacteria group bacterium]